MMNEKSAKKAAVDYCRKAIGNKLPAPKYVKKQCKLILPSLTGKDKKYILDEERLTKIESLLKILRMPKGLAVGRPLFDCLDGFQWLLIAAALCVVHADEPQKRRYTNIILEIARKNGKTFIIALLFILLFFFEPQFSRFFSVAPDGSLSREIKKAIEEIIAYNAIIFEMDKRTAFFKIRRDDILFKPKGSLYVPLNYSNSRLDGKLPNVFLCDEVGGLPNSYAFEAMRSGQITTFNKLGFLISTKYPTSNNPFEDEIELAKKILDGKFDDEETFSLLYEPDDIKHWQTNDAVLYHANPLAVSVPEIYEDLKKKRKRAIESEQARENFLCKHCNIIYQGAGTEYYISIDNVKKCAVDKIDFSELGLYVGVDLALTNDNCSVTILAVDDDNNILCDSYAFIPEGRIEEKCAYEKIDYHQFIESGKCIPCGDMTVDYSVIEKFVFEIEERFGGYIVGIGYDRYNALSSAQKWDEKYTTVQVRQHSDTLHPPTKLLYEKIMNGEFKYINNRLLEINYENAKCTYDTNLNRYINKKKSSGKVDMVFSTLDALYLLQQDVMFDQGDWTAQIV